MAVVLELECASESWRLLLGFTPRGPGWGLRTCISNAFPGAAAAAAAGQGPHFENS